MARISRGLTSRPYLVGAADARGQRGATAEALRVDLDEALLGAQSRHRHVDDLAVGQRLTTDGKLRRIRIDLDGARLLPDGELCEAGGGTFGTDEVRDASLRTREPLNAVVLQQLPDLPAKILLGHAFDLTLLTGVVSERYTMRRIEVNEACPRQTRSPGGAMARPLRRRIRRLRGRRAAGRDAVRRRGTRCARPCGAPGARSGP